jgi:exopolyphosphatase/guanosine-5'-triphosphate,3'-diphosphate pyrophosphatase
LCTAVLDIGTNTVLLLIAEQEAGRLRAIADRHAIARLGEGVDRTGRISEVAYERFLAVLREHQRTLAEFGCDRIAAVATSAMRDANNRDEIVRRTKQDTGIDIEILSGAEEARWTYRGAIASMSLSGVIGVVDIGGGSTEISVGLGDAFERGVSLDIGAVRLTERYFATSPIPREARAIARTSVQESLGSITLDLPRSATLVAVAGTPTTLSAMHQGLKIFDANTVHGDVLRRDEIEEMLEMLFRVDTATLLSQFPAVNKSRADILPAGTLILAEVMDYLGASEVTVSTQGLRYGIALRELTRHF